MAHRDVPLRPLEDVLVARHPRPLEVALARRSRQPAHEALGLGDGAAQRDQEGRRGGRKNIRDEEVKPELAQHGYVELHVDGVGVDVPRHLARRQRAPGPRPQLRQARAACNPRVLHPVVLCVVVVVVVEALRLEVERVGRVLAPHARDEAHVLAEVVGQRGRVAARHLLGVLEVEGDQVARDLLPLRRVRLEEDAGLRQAADREVQLPGQVPAVVQGRVHALCGLGRVRVGGVAGDEDPVFVFGIVGDLVDGGGGGRLLSGRLWRLGDGAGKPGCDPLRDAVLAEPLDSLPSDPVRTSPIRPNDLSCPAHDGPLHAGRVRVGRVYFGVRPHFDVQSRHVPLPRDDQHAAELLREDDAFRPYVGEVGVDLAVKNAPDRHLVRIVPGARIRRPDDQLPYPRVGPVASDEVCRVEGPQVPCDVELALDLHGPVVLDADRVELVAPPHTDAALGEVVGEGLLDHALVTDEDEGVDQVDDEGRVVDLPAHPSELGLTG